MSDVEPKNDSLHDEKGEIRQSEILDNANLLNEAFDGENREHEMGAWEAAKKYPWACFWAFLMCFTIVSVIFVLRFRVHADNQ